ncbi:N-formylglutamate amidohydrolase [Neorhizobium galegae bv. officinalis bv. officinalis str. HAMBI 1141]|uniref:N-formylglutamate amidohydrolase n=1 Tax=Neorhizobium galegae bv. officinalis bv. officinalis str. HAMBI 1141 TaxID=1028801 RepID=A0A068T8P2_NEOGA|nr:N-formylglutamate amidohydrolase [Neorhizobium galegae]CDN54479.1 N-formylglutamate amidohydrolase [Neorhizobium galegae bv. officinalis bv. officinalis str. HAMBI 1141]
MLVQSEFFSEADGGPVALDNVGGRGDVLLVCEHASRRLPERYGDLGLSADALASHIAWDPGALAVSRLMSKSLDATLIHQRFSRLIYDCNRPPDSPAAMRDVSEIFRIPGNENLSEAEKSRRTTALYLPFHGRIREEIAARRARGQKTVLVTIHSFTPVYFGRERPVEIGILHDTDSRLADRMLEAASDTHLYRVERNEPYGPADGVTHTLEVHALPAGLLNVMIEIRNDLITDETGQGVVADFLTGLLRESLADVQG